MSERILHVPKEWRDAAKEISAHGGPVMVIGASGSGKTTFCRYLAGCICRQGRTATWIDADPGQPHLGPPSVFSLAVFTAAEELIKQKAPLAMGFIGNTSPVGHLMDSVTALHRLFCKAQSYSPDIILINTCGLVNGGAARELTYHEIEMLAPHYVVALQHKNEVEHLIAPHTHRVDLLVLRLPVSPDARVSSSEARKVYREQRFKEYFRGADYQEIVLGDVGVHGPGLGTGERLGFRDINVLSNILRSIVVHAELSADRLFVITDGDFADEEQYTARERYNVRELIVTKKSELDFLLVGLNDDKNLCLGLGILRDVDTKEMSIRAITPLKDVSSVRHIALGTLRVNPAGAELGRW